METVRIFTLTEPDVDMVFGSHWHTINNRRRDDNLVHQLPLARVLGLRCALLAFDNLDWVFGAVVNYRD